VGGRGRWGPPGEDLALRRRLLQFGDARVGDLGAEEAEFLQVTDDHFTKALQKSLQQPAVLPRTESQSEFALSAQTPVLHGDAADCEQVPERQAPRVGLEQSEDSLRRVAKIETGAAVGDDLPPIGPELASVFDAWHSLPPDTRTAILAIVEATKGR
jgi:hypothetical protein